MRDDLRVLVGSVDLRVDGVSDNHIEATAIQSCSGTFSVWHGEDEIWRGSALEPVQLGYLHTLSVPRWLILETPSGGERRWDMAGDMEIPEVLRAEPEPPPPHIREVIEVVKGEARFRIKSVTQFTGEISDEQARVIINRAAESVQREHTAYGLDEWPMGLRWRMVAQEIYEGWT